jgi:cytochrome b
VQRFLNGEAHLATLTPSHRASEIDVVTRLLHLALVVSGLAAWLTGDLADDYEHGVSLGFTIHSWLGIGASAAVGLRLAWGIVGPRSARFSSWLPVTRERLRLIVEDLHTLLRFRLPERAPHEGLAGVVQSIGLLVFAWLAATGSVLFVWLEPGVRPGAWLDFVNGLHGVGEMLIPAFLAVHVGATIAHALAGNERWRGMFFLPPRQEARRPPQS